MSPLTDVRTATCENVEPRLPNARGPVSEALVGALRRPPGPIAYPAFESGDALTDDDVQLALATCYELHYRSFAGVDDRWEWDVELLRLRERIERAFLRRVKEEVGVPSQVSPEEVAPSLLEIAKRESGPSLSRFMETDATLEHLREFCAHRSAYQLKEADPHTWMIPRLSGRAKAAAVAIQYDEYGKGYAPAMHSTLFAATMRALDLDPRYGAYLDLLPASTLATGNLVTMFGLHRRFRAACVGHLALFEMTSVQPMRRYSNTLQRLAPGVLREFYDVHVEADAWHEQVALSELVGGLLESEPAGAGMVLFGARALTEVERRMSGALLDAWSVGRSSLLAPLPSGNE